MPISAEHIGRTFPPGDPQLISPERVAAFADALGDSDPIYRGADALVPPTFVMSAAASAWQVMFDDPELELSLARTVHADQRFLWHRPLRAGDLITPQLTITNVRARGGNETIGIRVSITAREAEAVAEGIDTGAEEVCVAESTFVHSRPAGDDQEGTA
ncbi:MaoC family dehydratase N-terminal domain-containing protein [Naumannella halotolerans]|uniref:FAS1-like dehydratase domain-containing protein n=1 Tax=Naumannella halotolerans TaxID=993414 RepID=UPI00370DC6B4